VQTVSAATPTLVVATADEEYDDIEELTIEPCDFISYFSQTYEHVQSVTTSDAIVRTYSLYSLPLRPVGRQNEDITYQSYSLCLRDMSNSFSRSELQKLRGDGVDP